MLEFDKRRGNKVYDGAKEHKLGTKKNPAVVSVQTRQRQKEVAATFNEHGWVATINVNKNKPEDLRDLNRLLKPPKPKKAKAIVGRNDPCPCGSGKKYKKCCGAS